MAFTQSDWAVFRLRVENAELVQRVGAHETRLRKLKPVLESLLAVRTGLSSGEVPSPPPDFVLPDYGMVELDPHAGAVAPLLNAHTKAALTWGGGSAPLG